MFLFQGELKNNLINKQKEENIKNIEDNTNNNFNNIENNNNSKIQLNINDDGNSNFLNFFEKNNKNINDNSFKKENNINDNFSFRNNLNYNKNIFSEKEKINNNLLTFNNKLSEKEEKNEYDQDMIKFCNKIKTNSPNIFNIKNFEKKCSQKQILRLKLEAFLLLKKYYIRRKSKSAWIKKKKKLIKLSDNFYRNLLLSRSFYGFVLNSKRKSLYNLIKNNYIDFRIKELSSLLVKGLKFCYKEKNLENKAFFELTKNKLRRILKGEGY